MNCSKIIKVMLFLLAFVSTMQIGLAFRTERSIRIIENFEPVVIEPVVIERIVEPVFIERVQEQETVIETPKVATTTKVTSVSKPSYTEDDLYCLAVLIYQEGGGDCVCDECRFRIGDVVLNRVADERFPNTIREVITQHRQYGLLYWTGVEWAERASNPAEQHAVQRSWDTAKALLEGEHSELYGNGYVFQAEFEQGNGSIYCCGHYFAK